MTMQRRPKNNVTADESLAAIGRNVGITPSENQSDKPPGMIMEMAIIIAREPMMQTNREQTKAYDPSAQERALWVA